MFIANDSMWFEIKLHHHCKAVREVEFWKQGAS
jgi:hypothetical protein